jgi:putative transposase
LTGFSYQPTKIVLRRPLESAQYACADYIERLEGRKIAISMSRAGNPYDNAKAESFMNTLKTEEVNGKAYANIEDARRQIGEFIETIYNRQRLHSALGYKPPVEFEAELRPVTPALDQDEALSLN